MQLHLLRLMEVARMRTVINFPKKRFQNRTQESQQNTFEISLDIIFLVQLRAISKVQRNHFPLSLETGGSSTNGWTLLSLFSAQDIQLS